MILTVPHKISWNDLHYCHWNFFGDHLCFTTQIKGKYSTSMCYQLGVDVRPVPLGLESVDFERYLPLVPTLPEDISSLQHWLYGKWAQLFEDFIACCYMRRSRDNGLMQHLEKIVAFCCKQRHARNWKCNCLQFLHTNFWACYKSYYFVFSTFQLRISLLFGKEHILCAQIFFCEISLNDFKRGKKYSVQGRCIGLTQHDNNLFCCWKFSSNEAKIFCSGKIYWSCSKT